MAIDQNAIPNAVSVEETFERMKARLSRVVPEGELKAKAELAFKINRLKRDLNAIILGHNYMEPALYFSIPDYVGDSLELARIAAKAEADIIVFCGVKFMAETAKILNPQRTVLIPSPKAGCSLAESITAEDVRRFKARFPQAPVVSYVNTYAEVKAESDYCCTSSNAAAVVRQLVKSGHARIIFLPDEYLAKNTAAEVGIPIAYPFSDLESSATLTCSGPLLLGWKGRCEVHEKYTVDDIRNVRKQFPGVMVLAHPECSLEVTQAADFTGSTKQMIQYVRDMPKPYYLLLTECSMADNIAAENPHREMLRLCAVRCPHMNEITLEQTLTALEKLQYKVELPTELMDRARGALTRMISLGA